MHWPMITILGEGETQILQFSRREQNEVLGYMEKKKKKGRLQSPWQHEVDQFMGHFAVYHFKKDLLTPHLGNF